ncbi:MAG: DMT family transporter [Candidatus Obscuribacterales bacterium]|nr:DMT family transporter [Candidatus Obscuribacterales bacterium]
MEILTALGNTTVLNLAVAVTLVCWGAWGITDKLALDAAPPLVVLICLNLFAVPASICIYLALCAFEPGWMLNGEVMLWTGLATASYFVAMILYLIAMDMTEASFILGITSAYPIILQFLSTIFLHEPLVPVRLFASLLVVIGIIFISRSAKRGDENIKLSPLLILLIVMTTFLWGVWGIFDKKALEAGSPLLVFFGKCIWDIVCLVLLSSYVLGIKRDIVPRTAPLWIPVSISAICLYLGAFTYLVCLQLATASYVVSVTGCYPLIMYLLALVVLKEKFNTSRLLGIVLITSGGLVTQTTQFQ